MGARREYFQQVSTFAAIVLFFIKSVDKKNNKLILDSE